MPLLSLRLGSRDLPRIFPSPQMGGFRAAWYPGRILLLIVIEFPMWMTRGSQGPITGHVHSKDEA